MSCDKRVASVGEDVASAICDIGYIGFVSIAVLSIGSMHSIRMSGEDVPRAYNIRKAGSITNRLLHQLSYVGLPLGFLSSARDAVKLR
jgi:hypothetical protein